MELRWHATCTSLGTPRRLVRDSRPRHRADGIEEPGAHHGRDLIVCDRLDVCAEALKSLFKRYERLLSFFAGCHFEFARRQSRDHNYARNLGRGLGELLNKGNCLVRKRCFADRNSRGSDAVVREFIDKY